ncbi:scarecrow-like protein 3 [Olea europaea var. sylvestris]|uniref:Scarecrow 3 n=1 Tax=Olea europaea subsp. europaea TaxID=158383 RepID=A0A8S0T968_OLEEU|nr:scarecrow-like protein 3 [Olea europaea var. sylvestris]CAA3001626.1 scarecrow 3 [Olea europaea subsp. europaea]
MFQEDGSSSVISSSLQMFPMLSVSPGTMSPYPWLKELKPEERGLYLIHLLVTCANHVATGSLENANIALDEISHLASPDGDTMQRIASYFSEALADRILRTWPGVYKAFRLTQITIYAEQVLVRKMFSKFLPFMKVAFVITNQAIVEAMEGEKMVHVIDLNAAEPAQWCALIQDLSARPEGPPHLRITGIHQQKEVLEQMAHVLIEEAEKLDIPFQFNPLVSKLENLDFEKVHVKTGEALAVSSIMQLHLLLASDSELRKNSLPMPMNASGVHLQMVNQMNQSSLRELLEKDMVNSRSPSNDSASSSPLYSTPSSNMDSFLTALWGLSPKIMVVTEQDSDHNGTSLMERISESLYFYSALFDSLESTLPRTSLERIRIEKMLGEEIKNIVACERAERKERHEKLGKWAQRFDFAGFANVPLGYYAMLQANKLLQGYNCDGYKIKEENGCVVICWQDRPLFAVSTWRFRR